MRRKSFSRIIQDVRPRLLPSKYRGATEMACLLHLPHLIIPSLFRFFASCLFRFCTHPHSHRHPGRESEPDVPRGSGHTPASPRHRSDRSSVRPGVGAKTDIPSLSARCRGDVPSPCAHCTSSLNLLDLIDGSLDGDALFFSRKLRVTGDTEAIVALRNALDDVDGGVVESITKAFGPLAPIAAITVSHLRTLGGRRKSHE